jgi:hypothetical protein
MFYNRFIDTKDGTFIKLTGSSIDDLNNSKEILYKNYPEYTFNKLGNVYVHSGDTLLNGTSQNIRFFVQEMQVIK